MIRRMVVMLLCFFLVVGVLGGYKALQIKAMMKKFAAMKPPPVPVAVTVLQPLLWQDSLSTVGTLRALHGVDLSSEATGLVTRVAIESGDRVQKGAMLVQLDDREERAQRDQLNASVELARLTLRRDQVQLAAHAIAQAAVDADQADLAAKTAQFKAMDVVVDKKMIKAPFSGQIGLVTVNPGQYINPGDKIASLQMLDPLLVDFNIPQGAVVNISAGAHVNVQVDAASGQVMDAVITALDSHADTVSRNVQVEATLTGRNSQVLPGMFARVSLATGAPRTLLTLPQTALVYHPYGTVVFVTEHPVQQGQTAVVHQVFVVPGPVAGDRVAIVQGLRPGETVVSSGGQLLKNGDVVSVDNRHSPSMDAHPSTPNEE